MRSTIRASRALSDALQFCVSTNPMLASHLRRRVLLSLRSDWVAAPNRSANAGSKRAKLTEGRLV